MAVYKTEKLKLQYLKIYIYLYIQYSYLHSVNILNYTIQISNVRSNAIYAHKWKENYHKNDLCVF